MTASDEFRVRYAWVGSSGIVDYACIRCGAAVIGYADHDRWHAEYDELVEVVRAWAYYLSHTSPPEPPTPEGTQQMTHDQLRKALGD